MRLLLRLWLGWAAQPLIRTSPSLLSTKISRSASSRPKRAAIRSTGFSRPANGCPGRSNTCRSLCRKVKWTRGSAKAIRVKASLMWPNSVCGVRMNFRRTGVL